MTSDSLPVDRTNRLKVFYTSPANANADHRPQANNVWSDQTPTCLPTAEDFIGNLSLDDAHAHTHYVMPGSPATQFLAYVPSIFLLVTVLIIWPSPDVSQQADIWMTATGVQMVQHRLQTECTRALSTSAIPQLRQHAFRRRPLSTSAIPQAIPHISTPRDRTICWISCVDGSDKMVFKCRMDECSGTYARWADFKRHYDGAHAVERPEYWCPDPHCERSQEFGGAPFPRKDKMMDHAQSVHGSTPSRVNSKRKRNP